MVPQAIDCRRSPDIEPPMEITAEMKMTMAIPAAPVTPKLSINRLTMSRTETVTPDIGQLEEPTSPVRYPARALARNAKPMVMTAMLNDRNN